MDQALEKYQADYLRWFKERVAEDSLPVSRRAVLHLLRRRRNMKSKSVVWSYGTPMHKTNYPRSKQCVKP